MIDAYPLSKVRFILSRSERNFKRLGIKVRAIAFEIGIAGFVILSNRGEQRIPFSSVI